MKRVALCVGVDDYEASGYANLFHATEGASRICALLKKLPSLARFDALLLANPAASEVERKLRELMDELDEDSLFFFYFAGYGMKLVGDGGHSLLFRDASRYLSKGAASGVIEPSTLQTFSSLCRAKKFFCIDAIQLASSSRSSDRSPQVGAKELREALVYPPAYAGAIGQGWALSSTRDGGFGADDGVFSRALESALGAAVETGEEVALGDEFVARIVAKMRELGSETQTPESSGSPFTLIPGAHCAGERRTLTVNGVECAFCWIPAGEFDMGSPKSEFPLGGETLHHVKLTTGFWLLETPVTQRLYESVTKKNPSLFKGADLPVETVSYNEALKFCEELTKLLPEYLKATLPTEAQWEYACRAGTKTAYWDGNAADASKMNYNASGIGQTSSVKTYAPNPWDLYDMHGNVYEWCLGYYGDYPTGTVVDPKGPDNSSGRVIRGGSWDNSAVSCRSAARRGNSAGFQYGVLGLRCVLSCD